MRGAGVGAVFSGSLMGFLLVIPAVKMNYLDMAILGFALTEADRVTGLMVTSLISFNSILEQLLGLTEWLKALDCKI